MLRFLIKVLVFLIFAGTFYLVAVFIIGRYAPGDLKPNINFRLGAHGHLYSRLQDVKTVTNVDVLFLGSSHAYRGFDTRIFEHEGLKAFNLGSSAQTPMQTNVLIDRYLDQLNPKIVVYEVYPVIFTLDGVESAIDLVSNDANDWSSFVMTLRTKHIKVINSFIFATWVQRFKLLLSFTESQEKGDDLYIPGGFVEHKVMSFNDSGFPMYLAPLQVDQVRQFQQNIDKLKRSGARVLLVYAPLPKVSYQRMQHNAMFDQVMRTQGEYYNFNERLQLIDSLHFYDADHLNQRGVERFNAALIEVLLQ